MAETWRVVLASGGVRGVEVRPYLAKGCVAEILAPDDPTRAELAAQLAAVTRERDVLRAQQAPLVACVDALRAAATAAGWRDADATGESLVAWVRRVALLDAARIAMERGGEWVAKAIVARVNEEWGAM